MFLFVLSFMSCDDEVGNDNFPQQFSYSFENDMNGWIADFADYPVGEEQFYELNSGHDTLPNPLDGSQGALMITGNNHSDDLFMFIKRKVTGFLPHQQLRITFQVEFASDAPNGSIGVGGSPAESVYVKVGASGIEPEKITDGNDYRMNIDKGNQSNGGTDMIAIGNVANGDTKFIYRLVNRNNADSPVSVTANEDGEVWLILGTDSGFEATTTLYYNSIVVTVN